MKAHLTKVSLALLSTVFLLGCQEQGSGPVGPEGLEIQAKKGGKGKGGGGGGGGVGNGKDLGATFTTHTAAFDPFDPTITTAVPSPSLACGCDLPLADSITPTNSGREMIRAIGLTIKMKSGKFQSVKVLVSDMAEWPRATADEVIWRTETIPVDPQSVFTSGTTTTIHLHRDNLVLTAKHDTEVKGMVSIADVVITPAQ